ncbi:MAG: BamA/TamA family outer membrane protein [Chitinophagales bacterium]
MWNKYFTLLLFGSLFCAPILLMAQDEPIVISDTLATDSVAPAKLRIFAAPVVGYTPETRFFFGAGAILYVPPPKKYPHTNASTLKAIFDISQNKQVESNLTGEGYFMDNLYRSDFSIRYYKYPDLFFGIGNNTSEDDKEKYNYDYFNWTIDVQRLVYPNLYAGFKTFFEWNKIYDVEQGGLFDTEDIPGEDGGLNTGLGLWLTYDTRDNIYFPLKGYYLDASAAVHNGIFGSDFNYVDYSFEYRHFKQIGKDDVLAWNVYTEFLPGSPPFNRMAKLGGDSYMRGNYNGRFRDRYYATAQAEYASPFEIFRHHHRKDSPDWAKWHILLISSSLD